MNIAHTKKKTLKSHNHNVTAKQTRSVTSIFCFTLLLNTKNGIPERRLFNLEYVRPVNYQV